MDVELHEMDPDRPADRATLVAFLTTNRFPFHVSSTPTRDVIEKRIDDGGFSAPEHALLRVDVDGAFAGIVVLDDLDDDAPMIDVRLAERARGHGIGTVLVDALARHVFAVFPAVTRIEAQTRDDNIAMRKALVRNGWVKEAHYRRTWPVDGGAPRDSVAYGLLREDHVSGTTTPLIWDDLPAG
ncbi:GNAT family N-acetyltransferase [Curtobacterium sp. MMLR14_010]|uniref:GNAT family N-acetyltransferase n=1 Tax=Curtobacterium sp. MMLR14_010 TaxID=1898743 RepID=UPI0008DE85A8|nr:GNAT family N-acetyltransferase [Curtobacterium sp. MMLR14_010]OII38367.1 GNAT family N-acetyltransferase [Curtobacterium sp. MMLR14_010]